jgi:hypothetical protein
MPEICLAAVQRHGNALQYVYDQTPGLCLAAVQQDGYALQYVEERIFNELNMIDIKGKKVSIETIEMALKEYFK